MPNNDPTYDPQPGDRVRVRRYEVPCPELPDGPKRHLVIELTGSVLRVDGSADNGVLCLDPHGIAVQVDRIMEDPTVTDHAMVGLGYVFLGQDPNHGVTWTLETEVISLAAQLAEYLAAKDECERLVDEWAKTGKPADSAPQDVRRAEAKVDALKEEAGEAGPDEPLCCRRYSRLHCPVFSVAGCRWYPPQAVKGPS